MREVGYQCEHRNIAVWNGDVMIPEDAKSVGANTTVVVDEGEGVDLVERKDVLMWY